MTHILQYRAATDRQDSLADNLKIEILDTKLKTKKVLLTQKTHERIVWGEPVSVLSSQVRLGHVLRRRRLRGLCLLRNGSDSSNSSYFFV